MFTHMKTHFIVATVALVVLAGGGCGRAARAPEQQKPAAPAPLTAQTIDLATAEIFVRSRDDVAPGQAEVNQQSLFAKAPDGQIVELVKDVHSELKDLSADAYLVQVKNGAPDVAKKFVYFTVGGAKIHRIFAFNKDARAFDLQIPIVHASTNSFDTPQWSPDGRRVAMFTQAEVLPKISTQVVYIGDLATGEVTHRYVLDGKRTLTNGTTAAVQPATKWQTPESFKVALYKVDGTDGGTKTPSDVVEINAAAAITTVAKDAQYQWDPVVLRLFGMHADGYEISAGATSAFSGTNLVANTVILSEVSINSPYVFLLSTNDFGSQVLAAVYDAAQHKFLLQEGVPKALLSFRGVNMAMSGSGERLVFFSNESATKETINLVNLITLKTVTHEVEAPSTVYASTEYAPASEYSVSVPGPSKWKNDNEFEFSVYTRGKEKDIAGGKKKIVNTFVKKQTIKFDGDATAVNTFTHPKFGFSFALPADLTFVLEKTGIDGHIIDAKKPTIEYGILIVQPEIPGVPLAKNKIESVVLDGAKGFLYHDIDGADGGKLDKMISDFPGGKNTVYLSAPELPGQPMLDLKAIAASWKWGK